MADEDELKATEVAVKVVLGSANGHVPAARAVLEKAVSLGVARLEPPEAPAPV